MPAAIGKTPDFERVVNLPVRRLSEELAAADRELMTPLLLTPAGRAAGAKLILWQGTALREIAENNGAYIQLGVGHGKTLIFWLAPYVLGAQRPLYICPAALRDDMRAAFREYAKHWITPAPPATIMAYSDFYRKGAVDLFEQLRPDFVGVDEAHKSTNQDGTFAQRLDRWKQMSGCSVVCGTGTGTRFSLKDFSHNITWALQDKAPLPVADFDELDRWCDAVDEKVKRQGAPQFSATRRPAVGVLVELARNCNAMTPDFQMTDQGRARWALSERLRATPGIIISNEDSCAQPLSIALDYAPEDAAINEAFDTFRTDECGPDGELYTDAIVMYTKERQLGCGVVNTWDPAPPDEWRAALRARNKYCAHVIARTRAHYHGAMRNKKNAEHPCDSPDAVEEHPRYGQADEILEWRAIRPTFEPKTKPTWVSASVVHFASRWARENQGLVWYEFEEFGRAVSAAGGLSSFGPGGLDGRGGHVREHPGGCSIALSIDANLEGRNLQDRWHKNLVIGAPQSARELEQLIGRTHRHGQARPVEVTLLVTSGLTVEAWRTARKEANFVRSTQGQEQKILRAAVTEGTAPSKALRWRVRTSNTLQENPTKQTSTLRKKAS
jgi:hypothetical protein